jgi:nitrogen fixation-related uncharacterized protein
MESNQMTIHELVPVAIMLTVLVLLIAVLWADARTLDDVSSDEDECILVLPWSYDGEVVMALAHPVHGEDDGLLFCPEQGPTAEEYRERLDTLLLERSGRFDR